MTGRRTPVGRPLTHHNCNTQPCQEELSLEKVLSELSFLRVQIDSVELPARCPQVLALLNERSLYGFTLEYAFPCAAGVSSSLSSRIRVPAKSFSSNSIVFKHRRVVLIKLRGLESTAVWTRSRLVLTLNAQLNSLGKYATRVIGRCSVPLDELARPPFLIARSFIFECSSFSATSFVHIDLGSSVRSLMERLELMRVRDHSPSAILNTTFTLPTRARSRSASHRSSRRSSPSPSPTITLPRLPRRPQNTNCDENSGDENDEVFETPILHSSPPEEVPACYRIHVHIEAASELPSVQDSSGRWVTPVSFVSIRGRNGEVRSREIEGRNPRWDWSAELAVSAERKNLVVKILHRDDSGADKPLCFCSIPLPAFHSGPVDYELVDLASSPHTSAAFLTMSVETRTERGASLSLSRPPSSRPQSSSSFGGRSSSAFNRTPLFFDDQSGESKADIEERLRKNLDDLENLMRRLPRPHH